MEKEELISKALVAQVAKRFEDMVNIMRKIVLTYTPLTKLDRKLLCNAYKLHYEKCMQSFENLNKYKLENVLELTQGEEDTLNDYMNDIKQEVQSTCYESIQLLEMYLIPRANDTESYVSYLMMKGDCLCRLIHIVGDNEIKEALKDSALTAYKSACHAAMSMKAVDSIRLETTLKYAVFCNDVLKLPHQACDIVEKALKTAELDRALGVPILIDSEDLISKCEQNLTIWKIEYQGVYPFALEDESGCPIA